MGHKCKILTSCGNINELYITAIRCLTYKQADQCPGFYTPLRGHVTLVLDCGALSRFGLRTVQFGYHGNADTLRNVNGHMFSHWWPLYGTPNKIRTFRTFENPVI